MVVLGPDRKFVIGDARRVHLKGSKLLICQVSLRKLVCGEMLELGRCVEWCWRLVRRRQEGGPTGKRLRHSKDGFGGAVSLYLPTGLHTPRPCTFQP